MQSSNIPWHNTKDHSESFFSFHVDSASVGLKKEIGANRNALFQTHLFKHDHTWSHVNEILTEDGSPQELSVLMIKTPKS